MRNKEMEKSFFEKSFESMVENSLIKFFPELDNNELLDSIREIALEFSGKKSWMPSCLRLIVENEEQEWQEGFKQYAQCFLDSMLSVMQRPKMIWQENEVILEGITNDCKLVGTTANGKVVVIPESIFYDAILSDIHSTYSR